MRRHIIPFSELLLVILSVFMTIWYLDREQFHDFLNSSEDQIFMIFVWIAYYHLLLSRFFDETIYSIFCLLMDLLKNFFDFLCSIIEVIINFVQSICEVLVFIRDVILYIFQFISDMNDSFFWFITEIIVTIVHLYILHFLNQIQSFYDLGNFLCYIKNNIINILNDFLNSKKIELTFFNEDSDLLQQFLEFLVIAKWFLLPICLYFLILYIFHALLGLYSAYVDYFQKNPDHLQSFRGILPAIFIFYFLIFIFFALIFTFLILLFHYILWFLFL